MDELIHREANAGCKKRMQCTLQTPDLVRNYFDSLVLGLVTHNIYSSFITVYSSSYGSYKKEVILSIALDTTA